MNKVGFFFNTKFYIQLPRVIDDNPSTRGMFYKSIQITLGRKRWEFIRVLILYKSKALITGYIRLFDQ